MDRGALAREFPGWQISVNPGGTGIATAFWRSEDGRSRRYLVATSAAGLLRMLREISRAV
jgi:hypothetical protein